MGIFFGTMMTQEVKVVSTFLESQIDSVIWCGSDRVVVANDETIVIENVETKINNILFMLTDEGFIYVTNSHGEKWSNLSQILQQKFGDKINDTVHFYLHLDK